MRVQVHEEHPVGHHPRELLIGDVACGQVRRVGEPETGEAPVVLAVEADEVEPVAALNRETLSGKRPHVRGIERRAAHPGTGRGGA